MGDQQNQRFFEHPPMMTIALTWLKSFPRFPKKITTTVQATSPSLLSSVSARFVSSCKMDGTLEERVKALEKGLTLANEKIDSAKAHLNQEITKTVAAIKQEEQTREAEDLKIYKKLEATSTGGVHISLIGTIWLCLGVIMSTASPEISGWFK